MRKMRPSGVEWIGEIPDTWKMVPNHAVFSEFREVVGNRSSEYALLSLTKQGVIVRDMNGGGKFPSSFDTYQVVHPGQMVFCLFDIDETPRTVGLCSKEGMITGAYDIFDVKRSTCDARFALYWYLTVDEGKHLRPYYRSLRKTLTATMFRHVKMPLPPLFEQQRIADYLDARCAAIDKIRCAIEREIDALQRLRTATIYKAVTKGLDEGVPMRDSGVEWIGEIPETWKVRRGKYLLWERKTRSKTGSEEPLSMSQKLGLVPTKVLGDVPYAASSFVGAKLVEPEDLVFNKLKAHLGVFSVSKYRGIVSPDYAVYHALPIACVKYLEYVFKTPKCIGEFTKRATGVAQGLTRLYTRQLFDISYPYPSLGEQQRIADYLDERCAAIDSIIDTRTKQLVRLEDYRKALIFAYVTGKREVPTS